MNVHSISKLFFFFFIHAYINAERKTRVSFSSHCVDVCFAKENKETASGFCTKRVTLSKHWNDLCTLECLLFDFLSKQNRTLVPGLWMYTFIHLCIWRVVVVRFCRFVAGHATAPRRSNYASGWRCACRAAFCLEKNKKKRLKKACRLIGLVWDAVGVTVFSFKCLTVVFVTSEDVPPLVVLRRSTAEVCHPHAAGNDLLPDNVESHGVQ